MLEPSSSEEEDSGGDIRNYNDESTDSATIRSITSIDAQRSPSVVSSELSSAAGASPHIQRSVPVLLNRASSPSPSVASEKDREDMLPDREEDRRLKLQLYVFVARCIACPFNAKQPSNINKNQLKVTEGYLTHMVSRYQQLAERKLNIQFDEAFFNAVKSYYEVVLVGRRAVQMVKSGGFAANDFREIFRKNIDKRLNCLPEIDGLSKPTVLTTWMAKFDQIFRQDEDMKRPQKFAPDQPLNKEQMYKMFQAILGIKTYEHSIFYNNLQLENADEQAAQVRREIDSRLHQIDELVHIMSLPEKAKREALLQKSKLMPKLSVKGMDSVFVEELRASANLLMANLESLPVVKGSAESKYSKLKKFHRAHHESNPHGGQTHYKHSQEEPEAMLSKSDIVLNFNLEVVVMEVKNLKCVPGNKIVYCTMEVEGGEKLQTDQAEAAKPVWDTQGDFTTNQPLPSIKIKLFVESSGMLKLEDKELGRVIINPTAATPPRPEWHRMSVNRKACSDELRIKVLIRMEKPSNMKSFGFLYAVGRNLWKKPKKRYFILIQVSQYTHVMCSYREKKSEPTELMPLEGFTVDYCDPVHEMESSQMGRYFFHIVKEGDQVVFATNDDQERHQWVQAFYRATGQNNKPIAPEPVNQQPRNASQSTRSQGDADRAQKHGLNEFMVADPISVDHIEYFRILQKLTVDYRSDDPYVSQGWLHPGQIFVLDEYCARYGLRGCFHHVSYLTELLNLADSGEWIDPTLMHYSFAFCVAHVSGSKPDGVGTVTSKEMEEYHVVKHRIYTQVEARIINFRMSFPFGRPENALKCCLLLLERCVHCDYIPQIMTKENPPSLEETEELKLTFKKCLEKAALVNYTAISEELKIEEIADEPSNEQLKTLEKLAEKCVDVLQQNKEFHYEDILLAFDWAGNLIIDHEEVFWSLFAVDMDAVLQMIPQNDWLIFNLFKFLNDFFNTDGSALKDGHFHQHLRDVFAPQVVRYVDLMESAIAQCIHRGYEKETWEISGNSCATAIEVVQKLESVQSFISKLHWPEPVFAEHLDHRLKLMASDMLQAAANRTQKAFEMSIRKFSKNTDCLLPAELLVMINSILEFKNHAFGLCALQHGDNAAKYHAQSDEMLDEVLQQMMQSLVEKFLGVLENTLAKLSRYDEGSFFSSILSLTKPTDELGKSYVNFMDATLEQMRKVSDDLLIVTIITDWYTRQTKIISEFLSNRLDSSLHPYQLNCLMNIVRKSYSSFEMHFVSEEYLNSKTYQTICSRLQVEEATQQCAGISIPNSSQQTNLSSVASNVGKSVSSLSSLGSSLGSNISSRVKVFSNGFMGGSRESE